MDTLPKTILSNIDCLEQAADHHESYTFLGIAEDWRAFIRQCTNADLVIIDNDQRKLFLACLIRPFFRFCLVSVDLILRPPRGLKGQLMRAAKRTLLSRVDKFIFYFKNTTGYQHHYGIRRSKTDYVPFKVNGRDEKFWPQAKPEGEYVLCAGRTLRDIYTFTAAMRIAGCPGVLLQQKEEEMREHGTAVFQGDLPPNLRLAFHVDGRLETFLKFIADAKLVVIPRFRDDIGCTGISTYLMAMGLGKCVILSRGPGAEDLLTQEAVLVEPENVMELAQAISQLWNDDVRRNQVAAAGQKYADSCQASDRLRRDILKSSLLCLNRPNFRGNEVIAL